MQYITSRQSDIKIKLKKFLKHASKNQESLGLNQDLATTWSCDLGK